MEIALDQPKTMERPKTTTYSVYSAKQSPVDLEAADGSSPLPSIRRDHSTAHSPTSSDKGEDPSVLHQISNNHTSSSVNLWPRRFSNKHTSVLIWLILILGAATSAAFLWIGLPGAQAEQQDQFERTSNDLVGVVASKFDRYVTAASYVHGFCRDRTFTRQDFRSLYEYLIDDGLQVKSVQFDPNVTREERAAYEAEARDYYNRTYPHVNYRGFVGFDDGLEAGLVPTGERDFYFPIHYQEPIAGNEAAIGLDYYSHISRRRTLNHCFQHKTPAITDRLLLVKDPNVTSRCGSQDAPSYGIVLMHPGANVSDPSISWPRDLASLVICIPALLELATQEQSNIHDVRLYIHDLHDSSGDVTFLGGVELRSHVDELTYLQEIALSDLSGHLKLQKHLSLPNKDWVVTVVTLPGTYKSNIAFVILGSALVFAASVCISLWVHQTSQRTQKFNAMKERVEGEKAALILYNTRQAARAERELNDFVAHEVRNPIASAMAACAFVKSNVNEKEPLVDEQKRKETREDVEVIDSSLRFVNDLLRNMLDMHRSSAAQIDLAFETTDVLHDILEPVGGMIYRRDDKTKVIVECEPGLLVEADCLRLKQVVLNLARNANKFVEKGFIRLRGYVVDGSVRLSIEDSGPGIPASKRQLLFAKFQESLDVLSQGTGIGLYLCKKLVDLMEGEIWLDDSYDSGIEGSPGTRITIDLNRSPIVPDDRVELETPQDGLALPSTKEVADVVSVSSVDQSVSVDGSPAVLPERLSVLFCDDDRILRRLFKRSIARVAPGWTMREAGNGEAALQLLDEGLEVDLCFMDQYMSSIERQLLGTETICEMRARGAAFRIVGLSANDLHDEFMAAGADGFVIKPFPTETEALRQMLLEAYGTSHFD